MGKKDVPQVPSPSWQNHLNNTRSISRPTFVKTTEIPKPLLTLSFCTETHKGALFITPTNPEPPSTLCHLQPMGFGYSTTSWASWPSCNHPRTLSFRANGDDNEDRRYLMDNPLSFDEKAETATGTLDEVKEDEAVLESVVRGVRRTTGTSGRLSFEPAGVSSSILLADEYNRKGRLLVNEWAEKLEDETTATSFKDGGIAVKVNSADPYADFRASMQEMIVAHGWMGWDWLQDMLEWYLKSNGKCSGQSDTILLAFVDMIMEQVFEIPGGDSADSDCSSSSLPDSPTVSSSSSSFSV